MDEGCLRAGLACCFQHIQGTNGIDINILQPNRRCQSMACLAVNVNYAGGLRLLVQFPAPLITPNIQMVMPETRQGGSQTLRYPAGIPLHAEKLGTLVVVDPMNRKALVVEIGNNFRSAQTG